MSVVANQKQGLKFKKGDSIRVTTPTLDKAGIVLSANNYPQQDGLDNWYIEFSNMEGKGYTYWKQEMDGGVVNHYA